MAWADARGDLDAWRAAYPDDPYASDAALRHLNDRALDHDRARREALDADASAFGRVMVDTVGAAVARAEHPDHLPELRRWDPRGHRVERVEFDPAYDVARDAVWASGLVAHSGTPGRAFEQATLLGLLSLEGEAGQACPATCTIGLARALRRRATPEVRDRFLPALLRPDGSAERASQFLTEVQGGSDVGANATVAEPAGDGTYRVRGEKWFCSVADAEQFLLTARVPGAPPGTRGLGCFVVPRLLDGAPNGFAIRRLKEKLGTRGMASGEIDLDGAVAWPIGPVEEGFKTAVGVVLNTSRWATATGGVGMMRRAWLEASAYARHRRAFGRRIGGFPAVRRTLATMKADWLAALHLVALLTELEDRIDGADGPGAPAPDDDTLALHRFLVNATKLDVSLAATATVRDGIEVLGGNGTIEDFSVLPRLWRDAIVYESWEGTHNVLGAQIVNDCRRLPLLDAVEARAGKLLGATPDVQASVAQSASRALDGALAGLRRCTEDQAYGAQHARDHVGRVVGALAVAALLDAAASAGGALGDALGAAAGLLARRRLEPGWRAEDDPTHAPLVEAVLGGEAGPAAG